MALARSLFALALPLRLRATLLTTTTGDQASAARLLEALRDRFGPRLGATEVSPIRSFYWWNGQVQADDEVRVSIVSDVPFADLRVAIEAIHPYEVPMIIAEVNEVGDLSAQPLPPSGTSSRPLGTDAKEPAAHYLKATFEVRGVGAAEDAAKELVSERLAACAQVAVRESPDVQVALKTVGSLAPKVVMRVRNLSDELVGLHWMRIAGNQAYLDWMDRELGSATADRPLPEL